MESLGGIAKGIFCTFLQKIKILESLAEGKLGEIPE